jgi:hypothetical protein
VSDCSKYGKQKALEPGPDHKWQMIVWGKTSRKRFKKFLSIPDKFWFTW